MEIKSIRYEQVFNIGNYESVRISAEVMIDPNDAAEAAYEFVRSFVEDRAPYDYLLLDEMGELLCEIELASDYLKAFQGGLQITTNRKNFCRFNKRFLEKAYRKAKASGIPKAIAFAEQIMREVNG